MDKECGLKNYHSIPRPLIVGLVAAIIVALSYLLTLNLPEWWSGAGKLFEALYIISTGYIINFLFYFTQIYLPRIQQQKASQAILKKDFDDIMQQLNELLSYSASFLRFENDAVVYESGIIYFSRNSPSELDFVNLDEYFLTIGQVISSKIEKMANRIVFQQCNEMIIEAFSRLQANTYANQLKSVPILKSSFHDIKKNYSEYLEIVKQLQKLLANRGEDTLTQLTDAEKAGYQSLIHDFCTNNAESVNHAKTGKIVRAYHCGKRMI